MTPARTQPFCKKYNINIDCSDGTRINFRKITQRNISLFIHNSLFCLDWKTNGFEISQALTEEL